MFQLCLNNVYSLLSWSLCLVYIDPSQARILAKYKPRLNTTSLIWQLKQVDEYTRGALENLKSTRHITIYYEDLIVNKTVSSNRWYSCWHVLFSFLKLLTSITLVGHVQKLFDVLDFLKVPRRKLVSRHVKIHTKPLSESIENWDEVYSTLNGTQYESFLTSDYTIWHHASPRFLRRCRYSPFVCVLFFRFCF